MGAYKQNGRFMPALRTPSSAESKLAWRFHTATHPMSRFALAFAMCVLPLQEGLQRRPKMVAVTVSVGLHLLLLLLFLSTPSASLLTGGHGKGNDGEGYANLTLIEAIPNMHRSMTIKPRVPDETEPLKPVPSLAVAETSKSVVPLQPPSLQIPQISSAVASQPAEGGRVGTADTELWSAIAPCWRRLADAGTLPVTLHVSFDARGGLSVPPVIDRRPDASQDPQTLRSEATALAALSQCGAYAMASGQKNLTVNFPQP